MAAARSPMRAAASLAVPPSRTILSMAALQASASSFFPWSKLPRMKLRSGMVTEGRRRNRKLNFPFPLEVPRAFPLRLPRDGNCKVLYVLGADGRPVFVDAGYHEEVAVCVSLDADVDFQGLEGLEFCLDALELWAQGVSDNRHGPPPHKRV